MTLSYFMTLILTLSFTTEGASRYKNRYQLLPLFVRSKLKFIAYLFTNHLKQDIYAIIISPLLIMLTDNSANLKISLLLLWGTAQILVRTYEYFGLKNLIWLLFTPLILSSLLFDETLTLIISVLTCFIHISSISSVMKLPLKPSKEEKSVSLTSLPLLLFTMIICLAFEFSPLSSKLNLSQIVPFVILIGILKLETIVTSKKEVIQRFQSYISIYRIRISTLSLDLLGPQVRLAIENSTVIIVTLIVVFFMNSNRLDTAIALTLLALYGVLSNIDLLVYHYIFDKSIVYENSVTRFIVTQIPSTLLFSYVTVVSVDMYLPIVESLPLLAINFSLIIILSSLIYIHIRRLMYILKRK